MRDRLIELLNQADNKCATTNCEDCSACGKGEDFINHNIADYLLASGVIVPPCPIGTKIYMLVTKRAKLNYPKFTFIKDSKLTFSNLEKVIECFGKTVFLTREEAEQAKERGE